jgi:hypothetical protein
MIKGELEDFRSHVIPIISAGPMDLDSLENPLPMVQVPWHEGWEEMLAAIKSRDPSALVSIGLPLARGLEKKVLSLVRSGASILHLEGDPYGRTIEEDPLFIKDAIRTIHVALVDEGLRDEMTLLASGGLSMAEHVAKSIICGVDGVFIDFPILIALECRICRRCTQGLSCPVEIDQAPSNWVKSRVVNLFGAWHNQLLEVMGAMGIRDARRLRGEAGRAMFFEDLDRATFGSMGMATGEYELD